MTDKTKFRWIYHPQGEKKIENFYVDGYDEVEDTIYEFLGCFYHGCPTCFDLNSYKKCEKTFGRLNSKTSNRLNYLKMRCSRIIIMKECQYKNHAKQCHRVPLKIRDTLYGGRTSPAVLYKGCFHGGKIYYVDFVSLYPSVQFCEYFPIKELEIIVDEIAASEFLQKQIKEKEEERLCGFIKCKILPPDNLYFPVLPLRTNDKLIFPLCFQCAKLKNHNNDCDHSLEERCFVGNWCLHEVYYALEKGYEILEIFEIIYYKEKKKLFEDYVAKFYCLKTRYSGIKTTNNVEEAKKRLSERLLENFGIYVKWDDIPTDKNEAMRYVMKLILNSLWGKLCQNQKKSLVYFVNDYEELLSHVCDEKYKSVYFDVLNADVACVVCNLKEENNYRVNKVCVSVGSYITCYSRLKLLKVIHTPPEDSILYYDTDSIIYYSEFCENILETGSNLGELSSELKENEHITTFVSTGPKSYSYVTNTRERI